VHESLQYTPIINLKKFCMDQEIEVWAIKLHQYLSNICILSMYRSLSGNFTHFSNFFGSILQQLYSNLINLISCGDININYNDNNSNKIQFNSLLATYKLQSTVDFPTRISTNSSTTTDNIFIDKSKNIKFTIHPYSNRLSDHNAQVLILHNIITHNLPVCSYTKRLINISTISEFKLHLSYESWENVFSDNDVNIIFNNFLNTYLRIFYHYFLLQQFHQNHNIKDWITTRIKISSQHKRDLFLLCRRSNHPILKNRYIKYCRVLSEVIKAAKTLHYNKIIISSNNKVKTTWHIVKTETKKPLICCHFTW
jgi:hypothetical protein